MSDLILGRVIVVLLSTLLCYMVFFMIYVLVKYKSSLFEWIPISLYSLLILCVVALAWAHRCAECMVSFS